ncbi:hypothetical protein HYH02_012814 [Chlamydomonas schloesseri]|uniref:Metallo-beta-lactamase domain-containing protein n=1 Tax=Chlamydomonas schloesseri TaxID=2026947 RepID=A0A835SWL0_9CHLO|nr:hypothetical protein HYH02_012814 [Chlamydomonas schloesseri]|eukprot:KAG2433111.1 hypothetical protein HYH02_012814 [Chlamydomonas schloesseri]
MKSLKSARQTGHAFQVTKLPRLYAFRQRKSLTVTNGAQLSSTSTANVKQRPDLSRKVIGEDPLPPFGVKTSGLVQLLPGVWALRQDFQLTENIYTNTFLVRLRSGGLMLISPPTRTEEAEALLQTLPGGGLSAVTHVVIPNLSPEHWFHAPDWAPFLAGGGRDVTLWTPSGLLEGRATASLFNGRERVAAMCAAYGAVAVLPAQPGGGPLPGLEGEAEAVTFYESTGLFTECTLRLVDYDASVFTDMAFAAIEHPPSAVYGKIGSQVAGIDGKLGCPIAYPMLLKDREGGKAWLAVLQRWNSSSLLCAHFDPLVRDGKTQLRNAFGFME